MLTIIASAERVFKHAVTATDWLATSLTQLLKFRLSTKTKVLCTTATDHRVIKSQLQKKARNLEYGSVGHALGLLMNLGSTWKTPPSTELGAAKPSGA